MDLYLPLAGVHVPWPSLLLLGLLVGILQGFFGVGGGWLTTPTLNILGLPIVYAIGTGFAVTAASALVGAVRHQRLGNLDVRLGLLVGLAGGIGIEAVRLIVFSLEERGLADLAVRSLYIVLLVGMGGGILWHERRPPSPTRSRRRPGTSAELLGGWLRRLDPLHAGPKMTLRDGSPVALAALACAGFGTGALAGLLGTGGGFVLVPLLVYGLGLTARVAVAGSLLGIAITTGIGTLTYGSAGRIEPLAAGLMFAGASIGSQLGASATQLARQRDFQLLFGLTLVGAGLAVLLRQFDQHLLSAVVMFTAASAMAAVIVGLLVRHRAPGPPAGKPPSPAPSPTPEEGAGPA